MDFALAVYDALVSVNVAPDRARQVVDSLQRDMDTNLATKKDVAQLEKDLRQVEEVLTLRLTNLEQVLRTEISTVALRTIVVLGSIVVATVGLALGAAALMFR